ncbi:ATP-binding protein [Desulfospira joergensenii]|uniref:ATP-binding protein n=1 Tax=Desulfospira joergensenii TaxID=53329 RepID=UPI0003B4E82F|nr:ATP-binding protein [Desulfospira joergensenii]
MKRTPLTIFKRLVIGNAVILLLVFASGGVVIFNLTGLQKMNREIVDKHQESIILGDRILDAFTSIAEFGEKYFVSKDIAYHNRFTGMKIHLENDLQTFKALMETDEQKDLFAESLSSLENYIAWFSQNATTMETGEEMDLDLLLTQSGFHFKRISGHLKKILSLSRDMIVNKTNRAARMTHRILIVTIITTILTVLLGMLITTVNTRWIRKSVTSLQRKTKEIARGQFKEIQTIEGPLEIQDLSYHFNAMCRRLNELDSLKADFISHVSHELRTPVTSIKEASTILSKGFYLDAPDKQNQLYSLIHEECNRLLKSVMRILDYSKMEARKMEYQQSRRSMPNVIRKSVIKLAPLAWKRKISLEFSPPPEDLPMVFIDEDRIIEVLDNLIGNAIKFTPAKGQVMIACGFSDSEKNVTITIEDNGPGIKLEDLEKIFYKFKQIDNGFNTRMGTGLGLSISKYIITAHGGNIWAESQYSKGTKILFTLPAAF